MEALVIIPFWGMTVVGYAIYSFLNPLVGGVKYELKNKGTDA